ncbi:TetR/AcrR family transcriptional regulator [Marinobacter salinisoli]|uniref:TetR/AcrR family transcriptional regulator n=1 Tax=Marinobacter salinisoli TaxID=2769486 RepID=A0ABX7MSV0_9GAMM|nr:TetR/AcrR family transcriptional regulator [Marinobacter salinisoli]QSP94181.1 TetR/AcrR family transcriptional regulator [Marinobacter salinisoli]
MARRKDHTPEELTELVLGRVLEFLQNEPADQLSLRKLAKMVGYSPGTLINLFGSYSRLILAANARTLDIIARQLVDVMNHTESAEEKLHRFAQAYLSFAMQCPHQWRALFEHHMEEGEELPQWQWSRIERLFEMIEQCLYELNEGSLEADRHEASRVIWAAVHGICALSIDDKLFAQTSVGGDSMINSLLTHYLSSWKRD